MKDWGWNKDIAIIELDVGALTNIINNTPVLLDPSNDPWKGTFKVYPENSSDVADWNGLVYVEFPSERTNYYARRNDKVMRAKYTANALQNFDDGIALMLVNGSEIPNASVAKGGKPGFSLVTNGPLYIKGHFNADGDKNTGIDNGKVGKPDDNKSANDTSEVPAMLVADTVTVLSNNYMYSHADAFQKATFTEIAAGIITGIRPTRFPVEQSGGLGNAIRLLEDWEDVELRLRGSIVVPYESEVFPRKYYQESLLGDREPDRNWAYSRLFNKGIYPPFGGPDNCPFRVRTFKTKEFRVLSASEYNQALANI